MHRSPRRFSVSEIVGAFVCVCMFVHSWFGFDLVVEKCNKLSVVVVFILVKLFSPYFELRATRRRC